jgi:hypothetical protein
MFTKYNFDSNLILLIILVFAIASNYHTENSGLDIFFGKYLMSVSLLAIGIWGIFFENGIVNASNQIQVTVVAAVTQYLLTVPIEWSLGYNYRYFGAVIYLALILTTTLASFKYTSLVERFFRFTFAFTFGLVINSYIYILFIFEYPICMLLGIAAVFYKELTLKRISIISSVYVFSKMTYLGFDTLMIYITGFNRASPHFHDYYTFISFVQFLIFIIGSYLQIRVEIDNEKVDNSENLPGSACYYSGVNVSQV